MSPTASTRLSLQEGCLFTGRQQDVCQRTSDREMHQVSPASLNLAQVRARSLGQVVRPAGPHVASEKKRSERRRSKSISKKTLFITTHRRTGKVMQCIDILYKSGARHEINISVQIRVNNTYLHTRRRPRTPSTHHAKISNKTRCTVRSV